MFEKNLFWFYLIQICVEKQAQSWLLLFTFHFCQNRKHIFAKVAHHDCYLNFEADLRSAWVKRGGGSDF